MKWVRIEEIEEYCKNLGMRGQKDSREMVVKDNWVRGPPIPTR